MKRKVALGMIALSLITNIGYVSAIPQSVRTTIESGVEEYQTTIRFSPEGASMNEVGKHFNNSGYYNVDSMRFGGNSKEAILYVKYFESKEDIEAVERLASLISKEVEGLTPKEKTYYITQRISELITYSEGDGNDTIIFSPTTAVKEGIGVCQAYARFADMVFKESGVNSVFVEGYINNIPHLWNAVEIDGEWSSVDITSADLDEGGKIDFSYIFMNRDTLKERGYEITSTPEILSNRKIQDFDGIGLVSTKDNKFYTKMIEDSDTIFSLNYNNRNLEVEGSGEEYWVVGGELFTKSQSVLANPTNGRDIYTGLTTNDEIEVDNDQIKVNGKTIHIGSNLPTNKIYMVREDFKVVINDPNIEHRFTIEETSNKTNVYYDNSFLVQYLRDRR